ncbi:MAG: DUF1971 domain-containing protein [Leptolyngbya sp. SIO1D8]|nr:DUF1971 domain-containing protein [Leptolyngbya sp. SIO1D8]
MKTLPTNVTAYRKTPVFNEATIPAALLNRHMAKAGSWAKISIMSGQLGYRILSPVPETHRLNSDTPGIVEPQIPHHVEKLGPVEFYIEFYRDETVSS